MWTVVGEVEVVQRRVQAVWNGFRKVSGVLCDKNMPRKVKGKLYRTCVRQAMLYGMETAPLTKCHEKRLEVSEMKMLRFSLGKTRKDKIRNENVRKELGVSAYGEKAREWRWYG